MRIGILVADVKLFSILVIIRRIFLNAHFYVFELIVCGGQLITVFLIGDFFEIEGVVAERIGDRLLTVAVAGVGSCLVEGDAVGQRPRIGVAVYVGIIFQIADRRVVILIELQQRIIADIVRVPHISIRDIIAVLCGIEVTARMLKTRSLLIICRAAREGGCGIDHVGGL